MRTWRIIALILLTWFETSGSDSDTANAVTRKKNHWYIPHFIPVQFAGNMGFISTGIGYAARKDKYQVSLNYGYAPQSIAGVEIHTLTLKNVFHLYRFALSNRQTLIPYGSLGVSLEVSGNSFFTVPSNMPDGYYHFPKSIHLLPALGLKLRRVSEKPKFFRSIELFAEVSSVDVDMWYWFISQEIEFHDIVSGSFGINLLRK